MKSGGLLPDPDGLDVAAAALVDEPQCGENGEVAGEAPSSAFENPCGPVILLELDVDVAQFDVGSGSVWIEFERAGTRICNFSL